MAASSDLPKSFVMKGGEGPYSYSNNSSYQREGVNRIKPLIDESIAEKLDLNCFSTSNPFTIADLGCSTGPNTFHVVDNIVEAVNLKYQQCPTVMSTSVPEFLVYFNDQVANDFNTLFKSIPPNKQYMVAAVPGSFHGRLFPKASLHFVHSSYTLHWLSMVPNELLDKTSCAWNKGRVSYAHASNEVVAAYSAQYTKDMSSFLKSRAEEMVPGGLMALVLLEFTPDETRPRQLNLVELFDLLGTCLMDMAKMGKLSEAEVDSFNIPIYNASRKEVEFLIEKNGCFTIEKMESLVRARPEAEVCSLHLRAVLGEGLIKHFGSEIIDEAFNRFTKKIEESSILFKGIVPPTGLFVLLKRKVIC